MLELKDLSKSYHTAGFTQKALDDVSVTLRDNEFVAVLGPSGSGKTTLLNIIGGLDHYDAGDLLIDGISTKDYRDRDWDTYRNNRIGFVFQSYNLIPHQSVLSNVELALTLSGVGKTERRQRARAALEQVGLSDHIQKRPNQLSGGQMQRVAIARALINDPEILLADEPTGALDSKTSTQIMALLQNIAADRLVVMVTHNPDLAKAYATRTIRLSDGHIVDDSRPVTASELTASQARPPRRAKMSFFTAIALSFSNLMTKKGRTFMMAFAGSIGIIGIAGILALANGVNNYIKTVEEETLSVYPLSIASTGIDMTALLMNSSAEDDEEETEEGQDAAEADGGSVETDDGGVEADVAAAEDDANGTDTATTSATAADANTRGDTLRETPIISSILDRVQNNDLASLKTFLDSPDSGVSEYVNTIQYTYDVTPQIYLPQTDPEIHQVHPDRSFSALGMGSTMNSLSSSSLMSMGMSTDMFDELLSDWQVYDEQHELLAGEWPDEPGELLLVTNYSQHLSDFLLYSMGLRDYHELDSMIESFVNEEPISTPDDRRSFTYEQILAIEFKLVYNSDYFKYDESYNVWVDHADDADYVKQLVEAGPTLRICGIAAPKELTSTIALTPGIYYTSALVESIVEHSLAAEVTQYQLSNPQLNIFTDKSFIEEAETSALEDFDMGSMFSLDEEQARSAFSIDNSALSTMDFSTILNPDAVMAQMPQMDVGSALGGQQMPPELFFGVIGPVLNDYITWCTTNTKDPSASFAEYAATPAAQAAIAAAVAANPAFAQYQEQMAQAISGYFTQYMGTLMSLMQTNIASNMQRAMFDLTNRMAGAMRIDQEAFANAFQFNLDEKELTALMMGLMGGDDSSLDSNLRKLGYADFAKPSNIDIYPKDFEGKQHVIDMLDDYNKRMEDSDQADRAITYTDIVGTLMSSVTEIIDMISMVLVAFVAISLVVSSIMIGVITYISVLERKKEIGILRSIGASKGDIANVFNAETLIVGFVAGCLGILITLLASIPANIIVYNLHHISNVALLPPVPALILVAVSCGLTFLSGLIPSSAASRKDPVEALRSE
ncbi:MAG: ABC transporter ATP-binding protein/permease [Coriobacteriales bacterium]|jgi:ABC-type lipoprotein export system ATPase subunit|nr:ABC transporter ATP-binding protein/permease [Coriobacteriales bacterium]